MKITVHTDGASRGNPGDAAIAYIIEGAGLEALTDKQAIGIFSNNQAEYRALLAVLDRLIKEGIEDSEIDFIADSELMIKQINGQYRVKDLNLKPIYTNALSKCAELKLKGNKLSFTSVRREFNKKADQLANEALDQK